MPGRASAVTTDGVDGDCRHGLGRVAWCVLCNGRLAWEQANAMPDPPACACCATPTRTLAAAWRPGKDELDERLLLAGGLIDEFGRSWGIQLGTPLPRQPLRPSKRTVLIK